MDLSLSTRTEGDRTIVEVGGEIDVYTAPRLREQLVDLVADGIARVEVPLIGGSAFDSLAGELLGRSLDELSPQTRCFLLELHRFVGRGCRDQQVQRSELRFTRRDVREAIGAKCFGYFPSVLRRDIDVA